MKELANMIGNDMDFENPKTIDDLLAEEMLFMTAKERNAIQEEVHGVICLSPAETPEFEDKCLDNLAREIDKIPTSEKQAYLRSQKNPSSHVHSKSFKMRFLRASRFAIPLVARRLVSWLDIALKLFGEFVLERPVRLTDFSKQEIQFLRMGRIQFLPFGDRGGRRIMIVLPDEAYESIPELSKARIHMYMSWIASNDIDSQSRGLVIIIWFNQEFKVSRKPERKYGVYDLYLNRCVAMHVCSPDTSINHSQQRAVVATGVGRARRTLRQHLGTSLENSCALRSYGIPVDRMPITYTGMIKVNYIRQWIHIRRRIENCSDNDQLREEIIEYPKPNDVIFRKGQSSIHHPANESFRDLILSKVKEQAQSRKIGGIKIHTRKMVNEIIREVQVIDGGRFLSYNDRGGWNEIRDVDGISFKIDHLIKNFRKSVRVHRNIHQKTILRADTSMFLFRSEFDVARHQRCISPCDSLHKVEDSKAAVSGRML